MVERRQFTVYLQRYLLPKFYVILQDWFRMLTLCDRKSHKAELKHLLRPIEIKRHKFNIALMRDPGVHKAILSLAALVEKLKSSRAGALDFIALTVYALQRPFGTDYASCLWLARKVEGK